MFEVRISAELADQISATYGPERSAQGAPSEWDFWGGPLQAALLAFQDFDTLPFEDVPSIRYVVLTDRVFGAMTFIGILLGDEVVEIASYDVDPDYWEVGDDDPDD